MTRISLTFGILLSISLLSASGLAQNDPKTPKPPRQAVYTITQTSWEPGTYVDDRALQIYLIHGGNHLLLQDDVVSGTDIKASFENIAESISPEQLRSIEVQAKAEAKVQGEEQAKEQNAFTKAYSSSLVFGNLYNCGRCNKKHLECTGAVVLSADGLVLTNYHVIKPESDREIYNYFAMTSTGRVCPVVEVLAASKEDDLALVRVDATDLVPVTIADESPLPMDDLFVISHPHGRFYNISTGVMSRYVERASQSGDREKWMQITASFSQGSSGSGVFNGDGELIGLVSRKEEIAAKAPSGTAKLLTVLYNAVPLDAIKAMLEGSDAVE